MFLGRPVNLWTGLIAGVISAAVTIIGATQTAQVAQEWAIILGSVGTVLGLIVAFLAGQPPTLNVGDTFTKVTPAGAPNETVTVKE